MHADMISQSEHNVSPI